MQVLKALANIKLEYLDVQYFKSKSGMDDIYIVEQNIAKGKDIHGNTSEFSTILNETWRQIDDILNDKMVIDITLQIESNHKENETSNETALNFHEEVLQEPLHSTR